MRYVAIVYVFESQEQLLDDAFGFLLAELSVGLILEMGMQAFARSVFHDEEDVACCVDAFVKFNDVGVVESRQNFDLSKCLLSSLGLLQFVPIILFDSYEFTRFLADRFLNLGIGSTTYQVAHGVIFYFGAVGCGKLKQMVDLNGVFKELFHATAQTVMTVAILID